MTKFTDEEVEELVDQLTKNKKESEDLSRYNQRWDIWFKIAIFLIGIAIVVCSYLSNPDFGEHAKKFGHVTTSLAALSVLISTFASSQFDFAKRQQIYFLKADAYKRLISRIKYLDTDKRNVLHLKGTVDNWNDQTPLEQAVLPEITHDQSIKDA